jgi:hypothetical protein
MSKIGLKSHKLAYLAGLLDGDGSIYIRLKKRDDCKYGYQITPYVVFFQSSKYKKQFSEIFNDFNNLVKLKEILQNLNYSTNRYKLTP